MLWAAGPSHPGFHLWNDAADEVSAERQEGVGAAEAAGQHGAAHCPQLQPRVSGEESVESSTHLCLSPPPPTALVN